MGKDKISFNASNVAIVDTIELLVVLLAINVLQMQDSTKKVPRCS